MPAPQILSVLHSATEVFLVFDRAVSATGGQEMDGLTFLDDASPIVPVFSSFDTNALIATLGAPVAGVLSVTYVSGSGTLVEAAAPNDPVASFTTEGLPYPVVPVADSALAGSPLNNQVQVRFTQPLASPTDDLLSGWEIRVNDLALDLQAATAALSADLTTLTITLPSNFSYVDVVDVEYDDALGDLRTFPGGPLGDFVFEDVPNLSTDGLPTSQYPLSWVTAQPLSMVNSAVHAELGVSLNPVDRKLVTRYGPVTVLTSGVFGQTQDNPTGIQYAGQPAVIDDGLIIRATFHHSVVPYAAVAAAEWLTTVTTRIGVALGQARAVDQSVTLGTQTVTAV